VCAGGFENWKCMKMVAFVWKENECQDEFVEWYVVREICQISFQINKWRSPFVVALPGTETVVSFLVFFSIFFQLFFLF